MRGDGLITRWLIRWFMADYMIVPRTSYIGGVLGQHFVGRTDKGEFITYCPISQRVSYNENDAKRRWCASCQEFFGERPNLSPDTKPSARDVEVGI